MTKPDTKVCSTPINKGNYSIEPSARSMRWDVILGLGWEDEYSIYRKQWIELPRARVVRDYPLLVDLELSTVCNLKCPMCYTITSKFRESVKSEFMSYELFTKVIDEISGKVPAVRLSLRGEPTLHPRFIDCIRYAKESGIGEVSTLTNGSMLTEEYFVEVLKAGLDWMTVSIDGVGEQYEAIRKPIKYSQILQTIIMMKDVKDALAAQKPVVKIQTVWPAIRENPSLYYSTFLPYVDLIAINPLIDYLQKDDDIVYEDNFSCPQHYQRLVIGADGKVLMCSNDEEGECPVGDANEQTIGEIWNGPELNNIRQAHCRKNGFKEINICKRCYIPRKTVDNEVADIDGRAIVIKNYVNRGQVIGK